MRKCILAIQACLLFLSVQAQTLIQEQFASSVLSFSTEYNNSDYSASQILGAPDRYPSCSGDLVWSHSTSDAGAEFIIVAFATPQPANAIRVYQTSNAGGIVSLQVRNASTLAWTTVYTATAAANGCGKMLEANFSTTAYNVDAVRMDLNTAAVSGYQEIDAISIANFSVMNYAWEQFAGSVIDFSSQWSSPGYSAAQALGAPNVNFCGDNANAWASLTAEGSREFLVLGFTYPSRVNRVRIYENVGTGAVDTIYLREAGTGIWHQIWSQTAAPSACPDILELNFTQTTYVVDAIRIAVNSPAINYWNEIDAVSLRSDIPPGAKLTAQSGNWSSPASWVGGVVPGAGDTVVIGNSHVITVDVNAPAKSVFISQGGNLFIDAGNTLTLGPAGGGKEYLQVQGEFGLLGNLVVNGNIEFLPGSVFTGNGGSMVVDGNDGTDAGSVANGKDLFRLDPGMGYGTVNGTTITIVDPQFHASGQAISGNLSFGPATTLQLGDGISTHGGSNPNGFGGGNIYPQMGNLIINATTATGNRHFTNTMPFTINGNCTVTSGSLNPASDFTVQGNLTNNAGINSTANFKVDGNIRNNGTITVSGGSFSTALDFINNASGVYTVVGSPYTSVGKDLVNDGSFTSGWLYFSHHFNLQTLAPQTIGGSGTFNIFGFDVYSNQVKLLQPFTINSLYFDQGMLDLDNFDLTLNVDAYGFTGPTGFVNITGTGRLVINNINGARLFPIGTSLAYTPVIISNGSGHNFAVSVRNSFSAPPPSAPVNKEWNITDLTGGPVAATITLQWRGADEDPSFTRNMCYVGHYNGSNWTAVSPGTSASGTDPYTRTATNVTTFSPFGVFSGGTPLPVHLVRFTAEKQAGKVRLAWTVDDEKDMLQYEVERSADGRSFEKIAGVQPVNMVQSHDYSIMDTRPLSGFSYYRLKQVNLNGTFVYSAVVKVDRGHIYTVFIYPNPARDQLKVEGLGSFRYAQLLDMKGSIIRQWPTTNEVLDLKGIASGSYLLRLVSLKETQVNRITIAQ